jgi:hypothetical protein
MEFEETQAVLWDKKLIQRGLQTPEAQPDALAAASDASSDYELDERSAEELEQLSALGMPSSFGTSAQRGGERRRQAERQRSAAAPPAQPLDTSEQWVQSFDVNTLCFYYYRTVRCAALAP